MAPGFVLHRIGQSSRCTLNKSQPTLMAHLYNTLRSQPATAGGRLGADSVHRAGQVGKGRRRHVAVAAAAELGDGFPGRPVRVGTEVDDVDRHPAWPGRRFGG